VIVSLVVVGVVVAFVMFYGVNYSSGTFIMKFESHGSGYWSFSAKSANGYSSLSRVLSQEDLDHFSVKSSLSGGGLFLVLSQGEVCQTIDLSEGEMYFSAKDLGMEMFSPGQLSMQLKFDGAKDVAVNVNWQLSVFRGQ